jgi:hypothetical protein
LDTLLLLLLLPPFLALQLSGVLRFSGAGLLLLRRLRNLTKLRFEQWTNTLTPVSCGFQAVVCNCSGL